MENNNISDSPVSPDPEPQSAMEIPASEEEEIRPPAPQRIASPEEQATRPDKKRKAPRSVKFTPTPITNKFDALSNLITEEVQEEVTATTSTQATQATRSNSREQTMKPSQVVLDRFNNRLEQVNTFMASLNIMNNFLRFTRREIKIYLET